MWRRWKQCGFYLMGCAAILGLGASPIEAADWPVIQVSASSATPTRLEVHVGERVRWHAPEGARVRIELDAHRDAHEVVVREGEIQAVFLMPGEHWYRGTLTSDESQSFRGGVVVREARTPADLLPTCSPESSYRVRFAP